VKTLKVNSLYSWGAIITWSILGFAFLVFLVLPYLSGELDVYVYGGDNFTYREIARTGEINELIGDLLILRNLVGLALFVKLAEFISLEHYDYVVLFLNLIILAIAIENFRRVFKLLAPRAYPLFIILLLANPYIVSNLCSANKEIFGFLFFSAFLRYTFERRVVKFMAVVLVSFLIRDAYAVAGILFFLLARLKINKLYYLVVLSIIFPFFFPTGQETMLLEGQDEKSLGISLLLNNIQSYPFGYVITYVPKLLLSAFADLSPLRIVKSADNVIGNFTTISAALTLVLSLGLLYRIYVKNVQCNATILNLFYAYTLVSATTIFIHYRYLFPLYPILVMLVLTTTRNSARELSYNRTLLLAPVDGRTG